MRTRLLNFRRRAPGLGVVLLVTAAHTAAAQLAIIRQGRESAGGAEPNDRFGWAVVTGDFDGDGFDDLASGAPFEDLPGGPDVESGAVIVSYGSPFGIRWQGAQLLTPTDGGYPSDQPAHMGWALAAGDFDHDDFVDLAVGLPYAEANGAAQAGLVFVYRGSMNGLELSPTVLHEATFGAVRETGDHFGASMTAGRLGSDVYDDLGIGASGENASAGAVFIIHGGSGGVNVNNTSVILGSDVGAPAQPGDGFGTALAIGNVIGLSYSELIVGAPYTDVGAVQDSGLVHVLIGTSTGVSLNNALHFDISATGDFHETDARFGYSLAVGNLFADAGERDFAVGAPGRHNFAGRVYVARGQLLTITFTTQLVQQDPEEGVMDEDGDSFGWAVATGDFDGDGFDDLVVGAPGEDVVIGNVLGDVQGIPNAGNGSGHVNVFPGGPNGPSNAAALSALEEKLNEQYTGAAYLGYALALGRTSCSARKSILAGAPFKADRRGQVFDIAPWRQVQHLRCQTAIAVDAQGRIVFALKPFEKVLIASTTKIMTVLLGVEAAQLPSNHPKYVPLDQVYVVESWMPDGFPPSTGCSVFGLVPGENITFESLLRTCIMVSGNDCAYAIADLVADNITAWNGATDTAPNFVQMMNDRAAALGMNDTHFTNPAGVDPGNPMSTAYDMYLLGREAMRNSKFNRIVNQKNYQFTRQLPLFGFLVPLPTAVSYNWLTSIDAIEQRANGIKPGGTPGAGSTAVLSGNLFEPPFSRAFAAAFGFRFAQNSYFLAKEAELLTLALDKSDVDTASANCDLNFQPPDFDVAGAGVYPDLLEDPAQTYQLIADLGPMSRDQRQPDGEVMVELQATGPINTRRPVVNLTVRHDTMFEIPPTNSVTLGIQLFEAHRGIRFRNLNETNRATLSYTLTHPATAPQSLVLAPNQLFEISPHTSSITPPRDFRLTIQNRDVRPAVLALEADYSFMAAFTTNGPYRFGRALKRLPDAWRDKATVSVSATEPLPGGETLTLVLRNPALDYIYYPPVRITRVMAEPAPANQMRVRLEWSSHPGFYSRFDVQSTADPARGPWTTLAALNASGSGTDTWSAAMTRDAVRLLRIQAVPSWQL